MRSRRQIVTCLLNLSDMQGMLSVQLATNLFERQWLMLHAEEQAYKKTTQETQKPLKEWLVHFASVTFMGNYPNRASSVKASFTKANGSQTPTGSWVLATREQGRSGGISWCWQYREIKKYLQK